MKLSENAYINRTAITAHSIIGLVLFAAYAIELMKGSRTLGYFAVFSVLCLVPLLAEFIIYKKNKESGAIKHFIAIGYSILYLFAIFTTNSALPFTYAFPMYMVIILYMDVRTSVLIACGGFFGNLAYIVYQGMTVGYTAAELPDLEIRMAAMVLTGIFMIMCCVAVRKVNTTKMAQIKEQGDAANALADRVLGASDKMITDIGDAAVKVAKLGESVSHIHDSMNEVTMGSNETAESVQVQLQRTEQIQQHIANVMDTTEQIEKDIADTTDKVEEGKKRMDELAAQVEKSMDANSRVLEQMRVLSEYTGQMNTIIETITSIANSTGMLALNASIEAARAGEAGRGFSVVATQISGLASQTKEATVNITSLIENINAELTTVETAIEEVTESNRANAESTEVVTTNFEGIAKGTEDVGVKTKELLEIVKSLEVANGDIVENIQTISAITEQVSAHAGETYEACEENMALANEMTEIVKSLSAEAENLHGVR